MPEFARSPADAALTKRNSRLAWFLDESIPLPGGLRVGWDGVIGLIPGLGDLIGVGASSYILYLAAQNGVSKAVLLRMAFNVLFEALIGSIPLFGDLFDFFFKANSRNLRLLREYGAAPAQVRRTSALWVSLLLLLILAVVVGAVVLAVQLVQWLVAAA